MVSPAVHDFVLSRIKQPPRQQAALSKSRHQSLVRLSSARFKSFSNCGLICTTTTPKRVLSSLREVPSDQKLLHKRKPHQCLQTPGAGPSLESPSQDPNSFGGFCPPVLLKMPKKTPLLANREDVLPSTRLFFGTVP